MAIRYTPAYNAEIRRVVRNFNQKRNRAIKRGFTNLPPALTVSELKSRYTRRSDLNRELRLISEFNQEDALETIETSGGVKAINWEVKYLKNNIQNARDFLDREIQKLKYLDTEMNVSKKELLNNLMENRAHLELELEYLAPADYRTTRSIINDYLSNNFNREQSYRSWLNEVEIIMTHLGYDRKTINKFFEGMDQLTPAQFVTMYRQNAIIGRLYELYIPKKEGEWQLSTSEDDAKEQIDKFMREKEEMIRKAKVYEEMSEGKNIAEFAKRMEKAKKEVLKEPQKRSNKLKREDLTPKQIEALKELGWEDIIE